MGWLANGLATFIVGVVGLLLYRIIEHWVAPHWATGLTATLTAFLIITTLNYLFGPVSVNPAWSFAQWVKGRLPLNALLKTTAAQLVGATAAITLFS